MSVFTGNQEQLSKEAWRLMNRQKSEKEIFQERQKAILRSIYNEWRENKKNRESYLF